MTELQLKLDTLVLFILNVVGGGGGGGNTSSHRNASESGKFYHCTRVKRSAENNNIRTEINLYLADKLL